MNGRVYDPELGRFLSADPLIQFPESTQGFDRYAYVGNSPLSYTDPSGHGLLSVFGSIVSVAFPQYALLGKFMIAVDGYMEGGLQGALFSVASMAASAGVGKMFDGIGNWQYELARAAVHGLIQGALGAAQGGKFGAAFMSAAVTSGYGSKFGQMGNRVTKVIGAAVLGGTVSRIGGGKFANGAVTGAFVQAFNAEGHKGTTDDEPRQIAIPERGNAYGSFEDAAAAAKAEVLSAAEGNHYEWGEYVFSGPDGAYFTSNTVGGVSSNAIDAVVLVPKGFSVVSDLHNHPSGIGDSWKLFSPEDVKQNRSFSAKASSSYRGSYIMTGEQMRVYRSDMSVTGRPSSLGGPAQGSARGERCLPSAGFC